jgi:hypothetical protein
MEMIDPLIKSVISNHNACPKCGAGSVCMSRFRFSDLAFVLLLMRPVRCQVCFYRWRRFASPFGDLFARGHRGRP